MIQETAELVGALAGNSSAADKNEAYAAHKWALRSEDAKRIDAMLRMAKSDIRIVAEVNQFERHPDLLGVENGTIDLRTGHLWDHRRADFLTQISPVAFDRSATAPTWNRLVSGIFGGYADLSRFVQRFCGYCLSGEVTEQVFVVFWVSGSNGKSVFVTSLMRVLGGWAHKANEGLFVVRQGNQHEIERAAPQPLMIADRFLQRVKAEVSFAVEKVEIQTEADPMRMTFPSTYHFWICDLWTGGAD